LAAALLLLAGSIRALARPECAKSFGYCCKLPARRGRGTPIYTALCSGAMRNVRTTNERERVRAAKTTSPKATGAGARSFYRARGPGLARSRRPRCSAPEGTALRLAPEEADCSPEGARVVCLLYVLWQQCAAAGYLYKSPARRKQIERGRMRTRREVRAPRARNGWTEGCPAPPPTRVTGHGS
jgi:hypothetical protein